MYSKLTNDSPLPLSKAKDMAGIYIRIVAGALTSINTTSIKIHFIVAIILMISIPNIETAMVLPQAFGYE